MPDPTPSSGKAKTPDAPANYTPLSVQQRQSWNNFLDFLEAQKMGGSPALDKRDRSLGLAYMQKYKAANPDFDLTPDDIKRIQYDQYLLRKGNNFPTISPDQLSYVRKGMNPAYMNRDVSQLDGWLGSITSKLYYPTARRGSNQGQSWNFGTDFETYVKSLNDPKLADKYLEKK